MIADVFIEASHFIYVVVFERVNKRLMHLQLQRMLMIKAHLTFHFQMEFKVLTAFIFTVDFFVLLLNVSYMLNCFR